MIIRDGTPDDIPAIVDLLRQSLGEDLMPKTEAFWRWKHVQNPFGASEVLLAWDGATLVGVRAFMKWEWATRSRLFQAVRAVDTATHPAYQGQGIFRKLTLALVDKCRSQSVDFIFNTPNDKSRPGYLKMGWRKTGRLPVSMHPVLFTPPRQEDLPEAFKWNEDWLVNYEFRPSEAATTHRTVKYFRWRYGSNPNVTYQLVAGEGFAVVFRIKPHKWGSEFRICDVHSRDNANRHLHAGLKRAIYCSGARWVTWAGQAVHLASLRLPVGPVVTSYPLTTEAESLSFANWAPSLGDMEVF